MNRLSGSITSSCLLLGGALACGDARPPVEPVDEAPLVTVLSPNGGEAFAPASPVAIRWTASDDGMLTKFDITYTAVDQVTPVTIVAGVAGTATSHTWTTSPDDLFGVTIHVTATDDAGQTGADESDELFAVVGYSDRGYVTSARCRTCHTANYGALFNSGHPYKLNKVDGGQAPTYPHSAVPDPPTGFTWDDISYVIGGYGWKARFMDDQGYIITDGFNGVNSQYNLPRVDLGIGGLGAEWVPYNPSDTEREPYTCGACHTTGWLSSTDNGGAHQDGLPGILGTWEEPGIGCEQCHGPGVNVANSASSHVVSQQSDDILIDFGSGLCGSCHFRDVNHNVLASGGFIQHHEQFDELIAGPHVVLSCGDCHDPHKGVLYGNADTGGIVASCESCHAEQAATNRHVVPVECESCHVPRATRSARAVHDFDADVRTHIFRINPEPVGKAEMFFVDATTGNTHTRGFVTLDFTCYVCHTDPISGQGGGGTSRSLAELSARATGIHN